MLISHCKSLAIGDDWRSTTANIRTITLAAFETHFKNAIWQPIGGGSLDLTGVVEVT